MIQVLEGNNLDLIKDLADNSIDSIVTDPPYELNFMGKGWDNSGIANNVEFWKECMRVLKPGGHLLSFSATRTYHRMAVAIEDAGFEIRDMLSYCYGSGFPKSLNIGKAVDKLQGNEREDLGAGNDKGRTQTFGGSEPIPTRLTKGYTEWEGWKTCLKPAFEPITLARKPISEKTIALNVLKWGTGGINIDACLIKSKDNPKKWSEPKGGIWNPSVDNGATLEENKKGRYPANLIHDGSEEVLAIFPNTKSGKMTPNHTRHTNGSKNGIYGKFDENHPLSETYGDEGSAARFFYCAKASKSERNEGLGDFKAKKKVFNGKSEGPSKDMKGVEAKFSTKPQKNTHVTVKPIALMRYLVRLVTPKDGTVLDPFCGSGTTGIACALEGFNGLMMEQEKEYVAIAKARIEHWSNKEPEPKDKRLKKNKPKIKQQLNLF